MSHDGREKTVPVSVVLISVGVLILLAAGGAWYIQSRPAPQTARLMPTAVPIPTAAPATAVADEPITLLPETPNDLAEYPSHFVSALEAAQPNAGQPIHIAIPIIGVDADVTVVGLQAYRQLGQTYFQWTVPSAYKAGWHNTSARLGQPGNTVLNGHHNIYGELFRDLVDLEAGDEIIVSDPEREFTYTVAEVLVLPERGEPLAVRQENAHWIEPTDDERLTLVTCWPYSDNTHRVVVVAYPSSQNQTRYNG